MNKYESISDLECSTLNYQGQHPRPQLVLRAHQGRICQLRQLLVAENYRENHETHRGYLGHRTNRQQSSQASLYGRPFQSLLANAGDQDLPIRPRERPRGEDWPLRVGSRTSGENVESAGAGAAEETEGRAAEILGSRRDLWKKSSKNLQTRKLHRGPSSGEQVREMPLCPSLGRGKLSRIVWEYFLKIRI